MQISDGSIEVSANAAITATVAGKEAFYVELTEATASASVSTDSAGVLTGNIEKLDIGTINQSTFTSSFDVTAAAFTTQIQVLVTAVQDAANVSLAAGVTIPEIFGIQGLIEVKLVEGYVELGVDATTTTFESIGKLMSSAYETA